MLNDILHGVYLKHAETEELYQRLQAFNAELDSKRIARDQLYGRCEVSVVYISLLILKG